MLSEPLRGDGLQDSFDKPGPGPSSGRNCGHACLRCYRVSTDRALRESAGIDLDEHVSADVLLGLQYRA